LPRNKSKPKIIKPIKSPNHFTNYASGLLIGSDRHWIVIPDLKPPNPHVWAIYGARYLVNPIPIFVAQASGLPQVKTSQKAQWNILDKFLLLFKT
jgi:hypothetical protein